MEIIDEAIEYYYDIIVNGSLQPPVTRYANLALLALEKFNPMKVIHKKTFWTYRHYCPSCGNQFEFEGVRFCSHCGQKLDWSNYWEALK